MSFRTVTLKRVLKISITAVLFVGLLASLLMIVDALNSERFEHLYSSLLIINAMALLALLALIALNLHRLFHQVHKKRVGAKLTVRLFTLLVILSSAPVIIVYYFSLEFLHQRLDNWFEGNIEQALNHALDLSRAALNTHLHEALTKVETVAQDIAWESDELIASQMDELRHLSQASELALLTPTGHLIAYNSLNTEQSLPHQPSQSVLLHLEKSNHYIKLEQKTEQNLHIRVVLKLTNTKHTRLLQAWFPIPERIRALAESVEMAFVNYKKKTYLRQPLKLSFTLVLSLVLLLTLFSAVWIAFFAARRFVAPLDHLAEGTMAVAHGNYDKKLPVKHLDELGFLVQSFNEMTRNIAQARDEVKESQKMADKQRAYLEAVLERLSSGVISLDYKQRLRTANPAANQILGLPLSNLLGQNLTQLQNNYSTLQPFCRSIHAYLLKHVQDWREEITLFGANGRKILICRGTQLQRTAVEGQPEGYVIVFDDVTTLIQAQRDAAWSEVARRLAHEIKNPLTPIQLSTERLRQKCLPKLPEKEAETLDRMTHTIIQQVDAIKSMVNVFSDYAKIPAIHKEQLKINQLIKEVLDLYHHVNIPLHTDLDKKIPEIEADRGRLRQVLHNIIKNALEAKSTENAITITSRYLTESCFECVELRFSDKGPGIPEALLEKIFEPYVTTKTKGTGLGLAIVKKIIDEHHGAVWIEQNQGTHVVIRLPVKSSGGCD